KRLHNGQQPWVVELEAWCSTSTWGDRGLAHACQLPTIDVRLEHVLLNSQVAVVDPAHDSAELRQVANRFADAQVGSVVAGGLGAEQSVVTDVLLDGAVLVLAADDRIAEMMVGDLRLETAA